MSWRDHLLQASFRGAQFHVLSHEFSIGRRNVVHQYPFKDEPYIEDLGADVDEFTIEAYVIANISNNQDYYTERNALISALKKQGSGLLVHPYLGSKQVNLLGKARVREIFNEGGIARFTMTFVLSGDPAFPDESIDPIGLIDSSAEDLTNYALDSFYDQYTLNNAPAFSINGMLSDFSSYTVLAKNKINSIKNATGGSLTYVKSVMDDARSTMIDIVRTPCEIGSLVFDTVDSILEMANIVGTGYLGRILGQCSGQLIKSRLSSTGDKIDRLLGDSMTSAMLGITGLSNVTGFGAAFDESITGDGQLSTINVTTESTARQSANRLAFVNMVKTMYLAGAIRSIIRTEYTSLTEVETARDNVIDSIDYMLLKLGDESASDPLRDYGIYVDNRNIYSSIEQLRGDFATAIKERFYNLPREIYIETPPDGWTTLHVAYNQYNDLDRDQEIFERNQPTLKHPGFIVSNVRVLTE